MRRRRKNFAAGWLLTAARSGFQSLGDDSLRRDVNLHRIADMQEEVARILDSPFLVGNRELRVSAPMVRTDVRFGGNHNFVNCAVDAGSPVHVHRPTYRS